MKERRFSEWRRRFQRMLDGVCQAPVSAWFYRSDFFPGPLLRIILFVSRLILLMLFPILIHSCAGYCFFQEGDAAHLFFCNYKRWL